MVAAGCAVGIVTFAQVLGWLFKKHYDATIAVLIGLMIGSLRKIWPWKETLETVVDRHGELKPVVQQNFLPETFTGEVGFAIVLAILGFTVVLVLDRLANSGYPQS